VDGIYPLCAPGPEAAAATGRQRAGSLGSRRRPGEARLSGAGDQASSTGRATGHDIHRPLRGPGAASRDRSGGGSRRPVRYRNRFRPQRDAGVGKDSPDEATATTLATTLIRQRRRHGCGVRRPDPQSFDCLISTEPPVVPNGGVRPCRSARLRLRGRAVAWGRRPWIARNCASCSQVSERRQPSSGAATGGQQRFPPLTTGTARGLAAGPRSLH
jgi:hypothetical protein